MVPFLVGGILITHLPSRSSRRVQREQSRLLRQLVGCREDSATGGEARYAMAPVQPGVGPLVSAVLRLGLDRDRSSCARRSADGRARVRRWCHRFARCLPTALAVEVREL